MIPSRTVSSTARLTRPAAPPAASRRRCRATPRPGRPARSASSHSRSGSRARRCGPRLTTPTARSPYGQRHVQLVADDGARARKRARAGCARRGRRPACGTRPARARPARHRARPCAAADRRRARGPRAARSRRRRRRRTARRPRRRPVGHRAQRALRARSASAGWAASRRANSLNSRWRSVSSASADDRALELVTLRAQLVVGLGQLLAAGPRARPSGSSSSGVLALELVAAVLQRRSHRVERCAQPGDPAAAVDREAHREVAAGQAVGGQRGPPHGQRHRAGQVRRERDEQREAGDQHHDADRDRADGGRVGVRRCRRPTAAASRSSKRANCARSASTRRLSSLTGGGSRPARTASTVRDRVLVEVRLRAPGDGQGRRRLGRVVGGQRGHPLDLDRQRPPRGAPRLEDSSPRA